MRVRFLAGVTGVLLVACGAPRGDSITSGSTASQGTYRLFVQDGRGSQPGHLSIISAAGAPERQLPQGTLAPDWSRLYTIDRQLTTSTLRVMDPATGKTIRELALEGAYEFPPVTFSGLPGGLSPNGSWLALGRWTRDGSAWRSSYLIVDTSFSRAPRRVELDGNFRFDALSNDGSRLYLLEYFLAQPGSYRVRSYDVAGGRLQPGVVIDKTRSPAAMTGTRLNGVASLDGEWLFSLYINGPSGPFIHALNLDGGFAWCINLPATATDDSARQLLWSLAMSRDGRTLYAVNGDLGLVTQLNVGRQPPGIRRTATLQRAPASRPRTEAGTPQQMVGTAALSPDGRTLFAPAGRGLVAIDTAGLSLRGTFLQDRTLDGLAVSPDGAWLYAVSPDQGRLLQVDPMTGTVVAQVAGAGAPRSLFGIQAAR